MAYRSKIKYNLFKDWLKSKLPKNKHYRWKVADRMYITEITLKDYLGGYTAPSRVMLAQICERQGWDALEAERLIMMDVLAAQKGGNDD